MKRPLRMNEPRRAGFRECSFVLAALLLGGQLPAQSRQSEIYLGDAYALESDGEIVFPVYRIAGDRFSNISWNTTDISTTEGEDYTGKFGSLQFEGGDSIDFITIPITNDDDVESFESFTLELTQDGCTQFRTVRRIATGTIIDDDGAASQLAVIPGSALEGGGSLNAIIARGGLATGEVSVDYQTDADSASNADDYTDVTPGPAALASGERFFTVSVTLKDDSLHEDSETFDLAIENASGASIVVPQASQTILNDDAAPLLEVTGPAVVDESNSIYQYTVTKVGDTSMQMSLQYEYYASTAEADQDYLYVTDTLDFAPGETSQVLDLEIFSDEIDERDEELAVWVDSFQFENGETWQYCTVTNPFAQYITITDDDDPPNLTVVDTAVPEGDGTVTVTFQLDNPSEMLIRFNTTTQEGTATAPEDYASSFRQLTISGGNTSVTREYTINQDDIDEENETFEAFVYAPSNVTIADNTGTITILDDDSEPSISVASGSGTEGGDVRFGYTLSNPSQKAITLEVTPGNGTAVIPEDLPPNTATVTITDVQGSFGVPTNQDDIYERDENFTITIANPLNATLNNNSAAGTISDDDAPPSFSIDSPSVTEGTDATFTVTKTGQTVFDSAVTATLADGTAVASSDYEPTTPMLVFLPDETSRQFTVTINADSVYERNETFTAELIDPTEASIGDGVGTGTIQNDDAPPSLSIEDLTFSEDDFTASFTITITGLTDVDSSVEVSTVDGTAISGDDYTQTGATVTITVGETSAGVDVSLVNDDTYERDETFSVQLSNPRDATIGDGEALATILNDDAAPLVTVSNVESSEQEGSTVFELRKIGPTDLDATVTVRTEDGTAVDGDDYTGIDDAVTFLPGEASKQLTITLVNDQVYELEEGFALNLGVGSDVRISTPTATARILNDDRAPSIAAADVSAGEDSGTAVFTLTKTGESAVDATVTASTEDGTAESGSDYTGISESVTFSPTENQKQLTITIIPDAVYELDEDFQLNLAAGPNTNVDDASATGTITNDDPAPSISVENVGVDEDTGEAIFTLTKSGVTAVDASVDVSTADDTAEAATDYTSLSETVTFLPEETTKNVTVVITIDNEKEPDETFFFDLANPENATLTSSRAIGTILDDDVRPELFILH